MLTHFFGLYISDLRGDRGQGCFSIASVGSFKYRQWRLSIGIWNFLGPEGLLDKASWVSALLFREQDFVHHWCAEQI